MPYVYILKCADGTYYTGSTWNIGKRLTEHREGVGAGYTAKRLPVELVYYEEFRLIGEAFKREKQIQGWSQAKKKALVEENSEKLHELSECKNETNYKNFK